MKRIFDRIMIALAVSLSLCAHALAMPDALVPVGRTVGIHLRGELTVAEIEEDSAASALRVGDRILGVNGVRTQSVEELRSLVGSADPVELSVQRGERALQLSVHPRHGPSGAYLGIRVRDGITGLGTVTFYDPETGRFGALGHGVNDPKTGRQITAVDGGVMTCRVAKVTPGRKGAPGELQGTFSPAQSIGKIEKNCAAGIFGVLTPEQTVGEALPVASLAQVRPGPAKILSNVRDDEVRSFSVNVLKIDPTDRAGRNYLLQICDEELLACTGGIVQGMSGSPIVQDGRLVGAVTHVLVDDPTIGYGISIGTMLEAAYAAGT